MDRAAILVGAVLGLGLFTMLLSLQQRPETRTKTTLKKFQSRASRVKRWSSLHDKLIMAALGVGLAFGAWRVTGWIVAALLGFTAGVMGPMMFRAPRRRRELTNEIEAYSQWTEQIRDLVSASGSLFEAVTVSASQAPERLRPKVVEMASIGRTLGLPAALDWFAEEMQSPFADRLVLGMKIAWDSGARVSEAFESAARAMRAEVEMRRRHEVANARAWTQVVAMLGVTLVSVLFMFVFNRGFFDPFGSTVGQAILAAVGVLIFGNVYWVLKLSESDVPIRLLASDRKRSRESPVAAAAAEDR